MNYYDIFDIVLTDLKLFLHITITRIGFRKATIFQRESKINITEDVGGLREREVSVRLQEEVDGAQGG